MVKDAGPVDMVVIPGPVDTVIIPGPCKHGVIPGSCRHGVIPLLCRHGVIPGCCRHSFRWIEFYILAWGEEGMIVKALFLRENLLEDGSYKVNMRQ